MELMNTITGDVVEIDPFRSRMARMRRRIKTWADILASFYTKREYRLLMISLTYATEYEWEKRHITDYLQSLKRYVKDNLLAYAWVAELQKRGALHYHIMVLVKKGSDVPLPDKSGMWKWGSSNIKSADSPYYLVTYLGKEYQKNGIFPKGIRIFAVWSKKEFLSKVQTWRLRLTSLPGWLREEIQAAWWLLGLYPKRMRGGGWYIEIPEERAKLIGKSKPFEEIFLSPWIVVNGGFRK